MGPWPLPRIPTLSSAFSLLPIPLCGLPLRSDRGGWGAKTAQVTREVTGYNRPLPTPENNDCGDDGKRGRDLLGHAPQCSTSHYMCNASKQQQRRAAKPRRRSRQKGARGKGKEVFGVWMQAGHTHIQHSPQPQTKT